MTWLKQSTASTVAIGPFVDSVTGVDAETALTIAQADIRLSKNGGAFAQTNNATGATHMENGYYGVPLDATDTGTLGTLRVAVNEAGALPVWQDFMVVPANVWDSLFGADALQVHAVEITAGLITAAAVAADAGAEIAAAVRTELTTELGRVDVAVSTRLAPTVAGRTLDVTATGGAGIDWANVENPTTAQNLSGTNINNANAVGSVGSVTGDVGGNVTGSVGSLAAQAKLDVNAEVDTAIADARLDELLAADSDIDGAAPPTVGSVFHELLSKTAGSFTFDQTTDSLEAIRDRGDAAWATATGFSTLDAAGVRTAVGLASANLDTQLSVLGKVNDTLEEETAGIWRFSEAALIQAPSGTSSGPTAGQIADEVQTRTIAAVTTVNGLAANVITPTSIASGAFTAAKFAAGAFDAVWSVATRLLTAGTNIVLAKGVGVTGFNDLDASGMRTALGLAAANLDTQFGDLPTAGENADATWEELIAEHLGAGSTGESLNNATAAGNPWVAVAEGALTFGDIVRVLAGIAAGKTNIVDNGGGSATVTFRTITDSADIVEAAMQGSERQTVTVTP